MGLRFDPVGGGQFKAAVKAIIDAESMPVKALQTRKAREESKMKLFQDFKAKFQGFDKSLTEFANFRKFRELKADLGDGTSQMSVTLDKDSAEVGSYNIQIEQLAARTSVLTNGFEDPEAKGLGIGFIVAKNADGDDSEIFVDENSSSLRGVETIINRNPNLSFRASVIKDSSDPEAPWRLMLSAKKEGNGEAIQFPEFYFLDGEQELYIDNQNEAQNAQIKLDGFPIETDSNDIKDFVKGVNVHLKQAKPDQTFALTITEDYQKISGKVKTLVDQINGILEFINKQNQVDDKTDTRTTFAGDSSLQTVEYRMRNLMHEGFPSGTLDDKGEIKFVFLTQMGIEFEKSGLLTFKEDKFTKALESNFDQFSEAITGENGFANQLKQVVSGYTRSNDGLLNIRETALRARIKQLDEDIERKERRLETHQQALTEQYARLEASVGNLQRQQQALGATMPSGGGGMVSQLLGG